MTSASELFHTRRSRFGRSDPDLGPDISPHRSYHHRRHHHAHRRHDSDGCDPLRRHPHVRHPTHRASHSGRTPMRHDQGAGQLPSSNNANAESPASTSSPGTSINRRLPGAVLLARERLVERLRGVSVSGNTRDSSEFHQRGVDIGDWATDPLLGLSSLISRLNSQAEQLHKNKKPPGLAQEDLDMIGTEVYSCAKIGTEAGDCSICLESFIDGDVLMSLPCRHRFHSSCLDPWLRTFGDCPYCRRPILRGTKKDTECSSR